MYKVTFLINSFSSGGAEKVLNVIINELARQGCETEVICLEKNNFYKLPKEVKVTYLSNLTGNESGVKKMLYLPIFAWKLKNYIKKDNIDLIQSHIYRANFVNILAKILGSKHKVQIVSNSVVSRYKKEGFSGKINLLLVKYLYPKADVVIWKSFGMKNDVKKFINFQNKQYIINNPYEIEKIKNLSNEKVDFGFDESKIYLVSVGRLIKLKRNKDVVRALKYLPQNVEILFIGNGEEKENIKNLSKALGLKKRVHFIGQVENPFKYISKCDIFIHTSETEGFPNVIVEALACRLPVVSSDCLSGPREILAPDSDMNKQLSFNDNIEIAKYGILFPVGNVEKIVKAVNFLIENKELYNRYKNLSLQRAKDFSIDKIIEKYKRVLFEKDSFK